MRNATYTDFSDKERSKLRYSPSSLSTHGAASFISQNYNQRQRSKQKKMTATTAQVCSRFIFSSIPQLPPPPYHRHSPFFHFFLFFPVALLHSLLHTYTPRLPCCAPSSKQISLPVLLFTFTSTFFPFFSLSLSSFRASQPFTFFHSLCISPYFFLLPFAALSSLFASLLLLLLFYFSLPSLCVLFIFSRHSSVLTPTLLLTFFFLRFCCRVSHTVSGHHHTFIPHPHRGRASYVAGRCRDSPCAPYTRTTRRRRCRVHLPT